MLRAPSTNALEISAGMFPEDNLEITSEVYPGNDSEITTEEEFKFLKKILPAYFHGFLM